MIVAQDGWSGEAWACAQVDATTSPAALCTNDGKIIRANDAAHPLRTGSTLVAALRAAVLEARLSNRMQFARIHTPAKSDGESNRRFDVTLFSVSSTSLLMLARDTTLEANLVNALAASRQLFRDLALCSNDFAFETDSRAHFTYTSPGSFLGHPAQDLHGSRPRKFFPNAEAASLFSVKDAISSREVWAEDKDGNPACIVITAVPMSDSQGGWCGARGVVRDLTELRMQERRVAQARAREDLLNAVVSAMRSQVEPRRMMRAAADALCGATESDCVTITTSCTGLDTRIGNDCGSVKRIESDTTYHGKTNGRVVLVRESASDIYQMAERKLLESIVPHLGIAIAFASLLTETETMASGRV